MPYINDRRGFTIIEVSLFLAISGFLIIGLLVGTSASISRQRYNDSVQDFAEFLRRTYSSVINVENPRSGVAENKGICSAQGLFKNPANPGETSEEDESNSDAHPGRTDCAIYGKLITFHEGGRPVIYTYDIIGQTYDFDIDKSASWSTVDALKQVKADVLAPVIDNSNNCTSIKPFSTSADYKLQWGARVETSTSSDAFKGAIIIARSPITGIVHTLVSDDTIEVQKFKNHSSCSGSVSSPNENDDRRLFPQLSKFTAKKVNFCIGSEDVLATGNRRRNIRLAKDGGNSTAVQLISVDADLGSEGNQCL